MANLLSYVYLYIIAFGGNVIKISNSFKDRL